MDWTLFQFFSFCSSCSLKSQCRARVFGSAKLVGVRNPPQRLVRFVGALDHLFDRDTYEQFKRKMMLAHFVVLKTSYREKARFLLRGHAKKLSVRQWISHPDFNKTWSYNNQFQNSKPVFLTNSLMFNIINTKSIVFLLFITNIELNICTDLNTQNKLLFFISKPYLKSNCS